jgi:carboxynorspermidine decarboxylase
MNALSTKLAAVHAPAYVADEACLRANLLKLAAIKQATGAEIMYAIKACPMQPIFPLIAEYLDGSTASGLFEARLGYEAFGKQLHIFCPAYTDEEIDGLLTLKTPLHLYFNSLEQLHRFAPRLRAAHPDHRLGLRINPALSLTQFAKYDPCRTGSHLGVTLAQLTEVDWQGVDILHAHALCENLAEDSAKLIDHVTAILAPHLSKVEALNFGGGHFITHKDYHADLLIAALKRTRAAWPHLNLILEPGAAIVHQAGYLVGTVLDVMENSGTRSAILDISPNCHVPDVIKAGVRMQVAGEIPLETAPERIFLTGRTCMASDVWGEYGFAQPLKAGDRIIMMDALQYSLGEANWFNGHPRPSLGILRAAGDYQICRDFSYDDFKFSNGG